MRESHQAHGMLTRAQEFMFLAAVFGGLVVVAAAQVRDLQSDLQNLNVRHATSHYALAGTVTDVKLKLYGQALEHVYREYAKGFAELLADPRENNAGDGSAKKFNVVVLAHADEYTEFTNAYFGKWAEHTSGMFVPTASLLVIRDGRDRESTFSTLFHEAFHQFVHRHVPRVPTWLNEGLATYYGTARPVGGGLVFDRPRSASFALIRDAARMSKLISLRRVMESRLAEFYDQSDIQGLGVTHRTLCYAQSYTLVSYMINDDAGREHLRTYIRRLSEAKALSDVQRITRETFPDDLLDSMVEPWLAHVIRG